ncbi:unnamed protein product, partial [Musa hybrid cultivar]
GNGSGGNRERGEEGDVPGGGAPGQGVRVGGEGRFRTLLSLRLLPEVNSPHPFFSIHAFPVALFCLRWSLARCTSRTHGDGDDLMVCL